MLNERKFTLNMAAIVRIGQCNSDKQRSGYLRELVLLMLVFCHPAIAAQKDVAKIDFNRDIRPILSDHCYACHGPDEGKRKAGLRLDRKEDAFKSLKSGDRAIVPGDVKKSTLVHRLTSRDPDEVMPPPKEGKPLRADQAELLVRWVKEGAEWKNHWAFIPPERSPLPQVREKKWPRNEIDYFVLERLEKADLKPAPEADKTTLIRRASFDLIGLPPTIEEVDAFLADNSPGAYDKLVDRLLDSAHYGERMAVNWLDLARYADTAGYHFDGVRSMWLWRDWVINAFNQNKPYDAFTIEQLAGDLLSNPAREQRIATGFVRNNMTSDEGGADPDEYLNKYVVDRVNTLSAVWLGMTVGCAECHDHKFDPVATREFYQLYAFFNNVPEKGLDRNRTDNPPPRLPFPRPEQAMQFVEADFRLRDAEKTLKDRENELGETQEKWERETNAKPLPKRGDEGLLALVAFDDTLRPSTNSTSAKEINEKIKAGPTRPPAESESATGPKFVRNDKPEFADGRLGKALKFDGKTHIDLGALVVFERTNAFSYGAWVKVQSDGAVLSKIEKKPGYRGFDLFANDGRFEVHLVHQLPDDAIKVKTKDKFTANQWQHVLATYDGSGKGAGVKLYVGGRSRDVEVEKDKLTESILNDEPVRIGSRNEEGILTGLIDDVRFYDHALSIEDARLLAFEGIMPIVAKSGGKRTQEERDDLRRFYKDNYAVDYLYSEAALTKARKEKDDLISAIPSSMTMEEMDPPRETFQLIRGDFRNKGEKVTANTPAFLPAIQKASVENRNGRVRLATHRSDSSEAGANGSSGDRTANSVAPAAAGTHDTLEGAGSSSAGSPPASQTEERTARLNRLDIAGWLVSREHPLTARVTVNRYWAMFFGAGLVNTLNDFGSQGEWPSHPDLLDWLACQFRDGSRSSSSPVGPWDVKALVRLIVTSATYRQSAVVSPKKLERDPYNRLLSRGPRLQLDAEFVRDNALAVSGLLNPKIGGPSVKPYQPPGIWDGTDAKYEQDHGDALYRRGMYVFWRRSAHYPSFATFDAPNREVCTFLRQRTQTPLQSLVLMNDPAFVESARALAARAMREEPTDVTKRLTRAFRHTLGRIPKSDEIATLQRSYEQQLAEFRADAKAAETLLAVGESKPSESIDKVELAAMTAVANVLLNLNETITK
jgi:uncharacterized protein DUF1553/uncharacterized protein DUF1549/concanavalin A-like lectin/glucanase superfamily protein/cytochrome c